MFLPKCNKTIRDYSGLRQVGAVFAAVAATAWVIERISGEPNLITTAVEQVAGQAGWLLSRGDVLVP